VRCTAGWQPPQLGQWLCWCTTARNSLVLACGSHTLATSNIRRGTHVEVQTAPRTACLCMAADLLKGSGTAS